VKNLKVKVKLSLCLIKHHSIKTYWSGGIAPRIIWPRYCMEEVWSASRTGRFTPREEASGTH
jgi:hypothetical protein